jgi:hypothetical protein
MDAFYSIYNNTVVRYNEDKCLSLFVLSSSLALLRGLERIT